MKGTLTSGRGNLRSDLLIGAVLLLLMIVASVITYAMTPRYRVADHRNFDLETIIPTSFAGWTEYEGGDLVLPDPEASSLANEIYNIVLSRIYRGPNNTHVMLVLAYGGDQSDQLQLHRPEVCYAANGFKVDMPKFKAHLVDQRSLVLTQLQTRDVYGFEPVTYWMRVGDRQVTTTFDRQWVKFKMGLAGTIPDGILVRVSSRSLAKDPAADFAVHEAFINDLLANVDAATRVLLVGTEDAPTVPSRADADETS